MVKRYYPEITWTPSGNLPIMNEYNEGDYVKWSDFNLVKEQLRIVQEFIDDIKLVLASSVPDAESPVILEDAVNTVCGRILELEEENKKLKKEVEELKESIESFACNTGY